MFELKNFKPGEIKKYYDLAHEKLRTVNGPQPLQFCEMNTMAYEMMKDSKSEFLRYQAAQARMLALGSLPIVRAIGRHAPSPRVKERIEEIDARARHAFGRPSLPWRLAGKLVEEFASWQMGKADLLNRPPVVSNPRTHKAYYHQPGKMRWGKRSKGGELSTPLPLPRTS